MPSVVGREAELTRIDEFLAERGREALALVGEPGIGKTTLWQKAVDGARERGATVLAARPAESEAQLAFGGLADLLAGVPPALLRSYRPRSRPPSRRRFSRPSPRASPVAASSRRRSSRSFAYWLPRGRS